MHIFLGLLFLVCGVLIIAYSAQIADAFGRWDWADQHLGGTAKGFVLIGFVVIIIAVFVMFGQGSSTSTEVQQFPTVQ